MTEDELFKAYGKGHRLVFHNAEFCKCEIGPRGAVREHYAVWRQNGKVQGSRRRGTWRLPVKCGLWGYDYIDATSVGKVHLESECPERARAAEARAGTVVATA